jgi:hypothetical protein
MLAGSIAPDFLCEARSCRHALAGAASARDTTRGSLQQP